MSSIVCPSCNTPAPAGTIFCDNCGFDLRHVAPQVPVAVVQAAPPAETAGGMNCPNCGYLNVPGAVFCENCGQAMDMPGTAPAVEAAPQPVPAAPLEQSVPQPFEQPAAVVEEPLAMLPAVVEPVPTPVPTPVQPAGLSFVPGRLIIKTSNLSLPIPPGKSVIVIGREDPVSGIFPEIDLDPHGGLESGVGRQHAQIVLQAGSLYLEDLSSVNGSYLNRQRISPRQPEALHDGDEIRLGKLVLVYAMS